VFENIIAQSAINQLRDDILNSRDAPSMLFFGPSFSGKGSSALELSRVYSCEEAQPKQRAAWTCACSACAMHRILAHEDILALGSKSFSSDILACKSSFLKNAQNQSAKILFYRSLRKLQLRFSPVILENDSKTAKEVFSVLQDLDEGLNDLLSLDTQICGQNNIEKLSNSLVKDALKLEEEGLSDSIPVEHIRSATYWCRLAPSGRRKTLIIENAEYMKEAALNPLLKLLEEPPQTVSIILTAQRREAIMPTILSRLRPYRFLKRDAKNEKDVIRRVFQDTSDESLSFYLDSFLEKNTENITPLAAWFIVSLARITLMSSGKNPRSGVEYLKLLGERYTHIAQSVNQERYVKSASVIKEVLSKSNNFKDISFSAFMKAGLKLVNDVMHSTNDPRNIIYNDLFRKHINEAVTAVDVYNMNAALTLEALFFKLKTDLRGCYG